MQHRQSILLDFRKKKSPKKRRMEEDSDEDVEINKFRVALRQLMKPAQSPKLKLLYLPEEEIQMSET